MSNRARPLADRYAFAGVELRPLSRRLLRAGQVLPIGSRAFDVLLALVARSPDLVTKAALLDVAWPGLIVEEANLHVQVSTLRQLLGPGVIATAPGLGYRLTVPVLADAGATARADNEGELIGRTRDLERVRSALAMHTLVTLIGPAGVGKSALARCIAAHSPAAAWVDLAAIAQPEHLAVAVANAAQVSLGTAPDVLEALIRSLETRNGLLVLDNIEHVVVGAAALVRALLNGAPSLRVLATGQVSLRLAAEQVIQLEPLALPRSGDDLQSARTSPALALLERRARARDSRFELTPTLLPQAMALLEALDGLPLAIEMAAARVPALGLDIGGGALIERMKRMHSVDSTVPARHRTLWAALAWSHDLLTGPQQLLLGVLSTFAGSFDQEQAIVAASAAGLAPESTLDSVAELVDRSLLQTVAAERPRYRMLETTRQFAVERLRAVGAAEAAELAHSQAMVQFAEAVEHGHWRHAEDAWLQRSQPDYDNLQLAFDRAVQRDDVSSAAALALALFRLDHTNDVTPPRQRRGQLLHARLAHADALARARTWTCLSLWSIVLVPGLTFPNAARQALEAWRLLDNPLGLHEALCLQSSALARTSQLNEARSMLLEAHRLEQCDWPLRSLAFGLGAHYDVALYAEDFDTALDAASSEARLLHKASLYRLATLVRAKIPDLLLLSGKGVEAITTGRDVVAELRAMKLPAFLGYALCNLCGAMLLEGSACQQREVPALASEAWQLTAVHGRVHALYGVVSLLAARQGQWETAARLLGAADGWYAAQEVQRSPASALLERATMDLIASAMDTERTAALRAWAAMRNQAEVQAWVHQVLEATAGAPAADSDAVSTISPGNAENIQ